MGCEKREGTTEPSSGRYVDPVQHCMSKSTGSPDNCGKIYGPKIGAQSKRALSHT